MLYRSLHLVILLTIFSLGLMSSYAVEDIVLDDEISRENEELQEFDPFADSVLEADEPEISSWDEFDDEPFTTFEDETIAKDVILVLDNSGSMKKNDPDFLTNRAVTEFIGRLDESTRIAIIIFDQNVSLAVPLTQISIQSRGEVLASLEKINYKGLFTDSPAAIERAIYELKNNGRKDTPKLIVFMTDGIVDTGNADVDLEKSKWLKESLAADAADASIRIFGIAFTEAADFQLIQSLAQKTNGEYYRALKAEDLQKVFDQINAFIEQPELIDTTIAVDETMPQQKIAPVQPQPVIVEVPVQSPVRTIGKEERLRSIIVIVAAVVLIVTLLAILFLLLRRGLGTKPGAEENVSEAYLNDIYGYTPQTSYKLGSKPVMLGRVAGKDIDYLDYIVIPESTIGRRHSLIEYKDFAYWIVDQGSINGTFVNDKIINSEVRLKHGDKIRLHKFEFEFVMPEMGDAGMTVVSNTMLGDQANEFIDDEATEIKGAQENAENHELDFDLSGGDEANPDLVDEDDEATIMPGDENEAEQEEIFDDSEDETLMPSSDTVTPPRGTPIDPPEEFSETIEGDFDSEDETLMPGGFDLPDDEATIRREVPDGDMSLDELIDLNKSKDNKED